VNTGHTICYKGDALSQFLQQVSYLAWHRERRRRRESLFQLSTAPLGLPAMHPREVDLVVFWRRGSRQGATTITGLTVGERDFDLDTFLPSLEEDAQRSMYAAGRLEKHTRVQALKDSIWNEWKDPIQVDFSYQPTSLHDFRKGPFQFPVTVRVANVSSSHEVDFTLHLRPVSLQDNQDLQVPNFVGRQSFRGKLAPLANTNFSTVAWVKRHGIHHLCGWQLVAVIKNASGSGALRVVNQFSDQVDVPTFEVHQLD